MASPKKRSISEMLALQPAKLAAGRKTIYVVCASVGDGTSGLCYPYISGRGDVEPNTNPARQAMADEEHNSLKLNGFFMHASRCKDGKDDAKRSSKGFDQKAFLFTSDKDLSEDLWAPLKLKGQAFCNVSFQLFVCVSKCDISI